MELSSPTSTRHVSECGETAAFTGLVERIRTRVESALISLWVENRSAASRFGIDVERTVAAAQDLCMRGGKRMRAALLAASYQACGGEKNEEAVTRAAMALELLQTYLLIHDDWMDADEFRRGGPTVHIALRATCGSAERAESAAVLAGDYSSALAQEVLLSIPLPPKRVVDAAREYTRMQCEVVLGQILDLHPNRQLNVETTHDLKTGSYTVRGPLLIGAALAGAPTPTRAALEAFARPLGVAFQLRDDLLGTFGHPSVTGKPSGNDLLRGKRTVLVQELEADPVAMKLLSRVFHNPDATSRDVRRVIRRLEETGVRARVESRIMELLAIARGALVNSPIAPDGIATLLGAATLLTCREY